MSDEKNITIKCTKCGLPNFLSDGECKRCAADLAPAKAAISNSKLTQCEDCGHPVSWLAATYPQCGRVLMAAAPVTYDRKWWAFTIGWGVLASGFILFVIGCLLAGTLMAVGTIFSR